MTLTLMMMVVVVVKMKKKKKKVYICIYQNIYKHVFYTLLVNGGGGGVYALSWINRYLYFLADSVALFPFL